MEKCIIFCAGGFSALAEPVDSSDFILAADGGLTHLQKIGLEPDGILGDFDSLGYVPTGAKVFPVEKDDTDSMLAVRRGLELGYRRFVLYGALDGGRIDHTVANFQTLQFMADQGATGFLVGLSSIATVVKNGSVRFPAVAEGLISVFCMGADATDVTIRGLQYPLESGALSAGFPLGVSNHFIGKKSEITVKNGSLLIIYDRLVGILEVCHADL